MNEKSREKRSLGEILKHPLANVVIGFLLTGVLGTSITQYYLALREKQKAQHELTVARKESIATLSTLNAEYLARAGRILAAVERGDKDSARELKTIFDDAAVRWQIEKPPALLAARDALPDELYSEFRDHLDKGFRERFLLPFGMCMESAMDVHAAGGDVAGTLQDCRAREYLIQATACSRVLLDMLHELSGYTIAGRTEEARQVNRDKYRAMLQQTCPMPE